MSLEAEASSSKFFCFGSFDYEKPTKKNLKLFLFSFFLIKCRPRKIKLICSIKNYFYRQIIKPKRNLQCNLRGYGHNLRRNGWILNQKRSKNSTFPTLFIAFLSNQGSFSYVRILIHPSKYLFAITSNYQPTTKITHILTKLIKTLFLPHPNFLFWENLENSFSFCDQLFDPIHTQINFFIEAFLVENSFLPFFLKSLPQLNF